MPSRRRKSIKINTINPTPLRRSHRLQQSARKEENEDKCAITPKSKPRTNDSVKRTRKPIAGSGNFEDSTTGLRRSPRLSNGVDQFSSHRRSPRSFFDTDKPISKSRIDTRVRAAVKEVKLSSKKANTGVSSCQKIVKKGETKVQVDGFTSVRRSPRLSNKESNAEREKKVVIEREMNRVLPRVESDKVAVEVGEKKVKDIDEKIVGVKRKRKKIDVGHKISNGWTNREEVALQRAFLHVKPTPHFWKNVAKLVPGKSAQDCFNKVHSDQLTPLHAQPRSRANKPKTSPLGRFSLSASKLFKPTEPNIKKPRYNKPKSHIVQKAARHLLRKHYDVDHNHEADLFSLLEPHTEPSTHNISQSFKFSTPPTKQERKSTGLPPIFENSSSNCKHPLSRFSSSCSETIISPPVLKQVKNKALHEKYIDQLHIREAKRKAASTQAAKSTQRMGNRRETHFQNLDEVKAALVSEAKDAIDQFRHLQNNPSVNSSEEDDDGVATDSEDES